MIKIFITGGTIDDISYEREDDAPENPKSLVPELLKKVKLSLDFKTEILILKESKFISDQERELIAKKCSECNENKIIITHGTNTMIETAKVLDKENLQKTIVLTGSAIPGNKKNSDALSNLNAALTAVQTLKNGVYISMNDKIFNPNNVKKNFDTVKFEKINK